MPKVKDRNFWESARYNASAYRDYYDNFTELAVSMWDWKNLPDSIDPRFLELVLFGDGKAVWFRDEVMGDLVMRVNDGGRFDYYNIPEQRHAYANNGYHVELNKENSVIIYNNFLRKPTAPTVEYYAKRLWDYDRTIDVNVHAQKTPILISCDEKELLTLKQVYAKFDGNEQVIFGNKGLDPDSVKVLKTDAPFVAGSIYDLRTKVYNECLEKLGIDTVQNEKGERMLVSEVEQGNGSVISNRYSRLEARRQACEKINKMFGLDIWVDFKNASEFDTEGLTEISGNDDDLTKEEGLE